MHDMYRSPVGKNLRQGDILDFVDVLSKKPGAKLP